MIDWNRIEELRGEVGEEDFSEIAGLFLEELRETAAGLFSRTEPSQQQQDYHSLKGSALNLGFSELAALCASAEAAPATADPTRIRDVSEHSIAALLTRFPDLPG